MSALDEKRDELHGLEGDELLDFCDELAHEVALRVAKRTSRAGRAVSAGDLQMLEQAMALRAEVARRRAERAS